MPNRPIMHYHGAKWRLANWIISHFPQHKIYVEPYGGGAAVLLRKNRVYSEVYNDLYSQIVNVFRILQNKEKAEELARRLFFTPFAREEYELVTPENINNITDEIERARMIILKSMAGFGSVGFGINNKSGFRAKSRNKGTSYQMDWANYPGEIKFFTERLRGVVIESKEAIEVINQQDSHQTLFYVDPPYVLDTRYSVRGKVYEFEMTNQEHRELADTLKKVKGMVVLSGYDCDLYQELYGDWTKKTYLTFGSGHSGAVKREECLWLNKMCSDKQKQLNLFNT